MLKTKKEYHGNASADVFCNAEIEMDFGNSIDLMDVYPVIEDAMYKTGVNKLKPYLTDFCLMNIRLACQNGRLETDQLALTPEMYEAYIPAITKAITLAFPDVSFSGTASYQEFDGYEFYSHQFKYADKKLHISSEILAKGHGGYFCPDCDEWVGYLYDDDSTIAVEWDGKTNLRNPKSIVKRPSIKEEYTLTF